MTDSEKTPGTRDEQEWVREQQDSMITALSSDYRSVYYVNLDADQAVCYLNDKTLADMPASGERFPYLQQFTEFGNTHVAESYREGYFRFIQPENIRKELLRQPVIAFRFLEYREGQEKYTMLRMAGVRHMEDRPDHLVHAIGVGFTDIDEEMRKNMVQQQVLSDALAAAEQANRAKTAFLSNMSHEIRTPMNAIIGLNSLALRNRDIPQETREYLEKIGESARHLLGLINDILDMSRIESGRIVLRQEPFSLRAVIEQINTMVSAQCSEKGLNYECTLISGVSDFYIGDDMKLKQVLINILSNAIKFTDPPGSVTMSVERTASYEDRTTMKFIVKDTGIGIDPAFLPNIFDSFTQEDSSRNNRFGSTGLGMAITKNIVTLMNGTISVESEKGAGSEFTVILTLKNCDHPLTHSRSINLSDMNVLIVDDENIAAEHARIILDDAGIRADSCCSGAEALNLLEIANAIHRPYNLVLTDWKMPEMDGLALTAEIRRRYEKDSLAIILTAFSWDEIMEKALQIGVDSFLAKPLFASSVISEFERIARRNEMNLLTEKTRADLQGRRLLVAEDILINAEILQELIKMKDADSDLAENGRIAVEMFRDSPEGTYDAILMDVRMPEMDGLEAAKTIRSLDRPDAKTIPIIALTANAFDEDVQRSMQFGMNAHLSKPTEPDLLYQTLEELIWQAEHS
ncbi:MAG: response regulator [Solobacterium sp.]|nr:response regulator [Solobacterium sp.]